MSRKFQVKSIPSTWLISNGRRLDCGPYMSGAVEIRELLKRHFTQKLPDLTSGHDGGIYYGPRSNRNYVTDAEHGVPFLTTTFMMQADLTRLPLVSKKEAKSRKLANQQVKQGMALISRSGTVGRTIYARSSMNKVWSNEDIIKIVVDPQQVKSGYLFAYLCTRFGVPFVLSGKYGSVISHLEPEHFSDLLVPRLDADIEQKAHDFIEESAAFLDNYQANLNDATELYFDSVGLKDITPSEWHSWGSDLGFTAPTSIQSLRALNFNPRFIRLCELIKSGPWKPLGSLCIPGTLKRGNRFNRIDADPEYAYRLVGQKELFWLRPEGRWIAKKFVPDDVLVENGSILVAARGTLGESELYCRATFIHGKLTENAYSEDILRVIGNENEIERGALFAFMRSESAFRMLRSISVGSKLQDHHYTMLPSLPIPYPPNDIRKRCNDFIIEAYVARETALELEDRARSLVERAIEEGGR
ncbi:restriction endonuclease subunit S [Desulfovibrio sulfodismutans]|uniref:Restriction endonuclease subunit S n=1 Tax=Desulfolutivibrio sulfodismutans TaxID=63561 RepID=A0A7K3NJ73_9BACT|nr:restriction endonuclease subunit S [Desulfolutivibrio sulfodismutans]NDY55825.1 restriction endonuclease subunit S [Desulfolutivibrio sulfodismutans]QLA14228.1 restriction endonuclease subunit S [Desulfolutivibrio sulfodismutans DSM 3696]